MEINGTVQTGPIASDLTPPLQAELEHYPFERTAARESVLAQIRAERRETVAALRALDSSLMDARRVARNARIKQCVAALRECFPGFDELEDMQFLAAAARELQFEFRQFARQQRDLSRRAKRLSEAEETVAAIES